MSSTVSGFVLIAIGVLSMLGAAFNWSIVSRSGKLINRLLGDTIARVIYFIVGFAVFFLGVGLMIGASWIKP